MAATNVSLILFIHGFRGDAAATWGQFERLIRDDPVFDGVAVETFSYPASLGLRRPLRRNPTIQLLADGLGTTIEHRYAEHTSIALVAHSLGGLVARRYVADRFLDERDPPPIAKLLLFAVPNDGAALARLARTISWRQPQLRQLCRRSDFIEDLNRQWDKFDVSSRLDVLSVVAAQDAVVDAAFTRRLGGVAVLPDKDHRSCVKPTSSDDLAYAVLRRHLTKATGDRQQSAAEGFRVVAFDLGGSLLRGMSFSWTLIWDALEYPEHVHRDALKRYAAGQWTYQQWSTWAVTKFRARGLTKQKIEALAENVTVTRNLRPALARLRAAHYRLALISGGIDTLLYAKIPDADELFDDIFINRLEFDESGLISGVHATAYDFEAKVAALQRVTDAAGCGLANAVFVGDAFNDAHVSNQAGFSIAYPPGFSEQATLADVRIEIDDLNAVVDAVLAAG